MRGHPAGLTGREGAELWLVTVSVAWHQAAMCGSRLSPGALSEPCVTDGMVGGMQSALLKTKRVKTLKGLGRNGFTHLASDHHPSLSSYLVHIHPDGNHIGGAFLLALKCVLTVMSFDANPLKGERKSTCVGPLPGALRSPITLWSSVITVAV